MQFFFLNLGVRLIQEKLKSVVLVRDQRKVKLLFFVILREMLTLCSFYSCCIEAAFHFRCGPLPIFLKLLWVNMKVSPKQMKTNFQDILCIFFLIVLFLGYSLFFIVLFLGYSLYFFLIVLFLGYSLFLIVLFLGYSLYFFLQFYFQDIVYFFLIVLFLGYSLFFFLIVIFLGYSLYFFFLQFYFQCDNANNCCVIYLVTVIPS